MHESNLDGTRKQEPLTELRIYPEDTDTLFELIIHYQERGQYDAQAEICRQLLTRDLSDCDRAEALHYLASALYEQGDLEEAITRAEDLIAFFPGYRYLSSVHWLLGTMYSEQATRQEHTETRKQDWLASEVNLSRALDLVEDQQERAVVLVDLGIVLRNSGRLEQAKQSFEEALKIGIENSSYLELCYSQLGETFSDLGEDELARLYLEKLASLDSDQPSNPRAMAYVYLAAIYREKGDAKRAERYCQQAMQMLDRSNTKEAAHILGYIYEELGNNYLQRGAYEEAANSFHNALRQSQEVNQQANLWQKLGTALEKSKQYRQSLKAFQQALTTRLSLQQTNVPIDVGDLLLSMGRCFYNLDNFQQAIMLFEEAAKNLRPQLLAEAHLWLGHSYFSLQRYDRAVEAYRKVLRETGCLSTYWKPAMTYLLWSKMLK